MTSGTTRRAVLKRANRSCEDCGEKTRLELHHLRYAPDGCDHDGIPLAAFPGWETPNDLDALCRDCHHSRHVDLNGDFWRDPQEMEDHWWGYWNEMDKD